MTSAQEPPYSPRYGVSRALLRLRIDRDRRFVHLRASSRRRSLTAAQVEMVAPWAPVGFRRIAASQCAIARRRSCHGQPIRQMAEGLPVSHRQSGPGFARLARARRRRLMPSNRFSFVSDSPSRMPPVSSRRSRQRAWYSEPQIQPAHVLVNIAQCCQGYTSSAVVAADAASFTNTPAGLEPSPQPEAIAIAARALAACYSRPHRARSAPAQSAAGTGPRRKWRRPPCIPVSSPTAETAPRAASIASFQQPQRSITPNPSGGNLTSGAKPRSRSISSCCESPRAPEQPRHKQREACPGLAL